MVERGKRGVRSLVRKIVIAASAVVAVVGAFVGSGAAGGTPIQDAAGGALSASATAIAPAGPAFGIWSVVYTGLIAFAVWQFLPHRSEAVVRRHDALAVPVTLSLLLNAAWILSVQFGLLRTSVAVIVLLVLDLGWTFAVLRRTARASTFVEAVVTDGTFGLYLGWVCVATAANIAAALAASGFRGFGLGQDLWGAVIAAVAGLVGVLLAVVGRGRLASAASLAWGLAWVAVARIDGPLVSVPTAATAICAAAVAVVATLASRRRAGHVRAQGIRPDASAVGRTPRAS